MVGTAGDDEVHGGTRTAILVLAAALAVFLVLVAVGMVTHPSDRPTILHSWNDFYSWVVNSNFAGIALGLLIPVIPLAAIAEVHHRRTMAKIAVHRDIIRVHHKILEEIRDRLDAPVLPPKHDDDPGLSTPDSD